MAMGVPPLGRDLRAKKAQLSSGSLNRDPSSFTSFTLLNKSNLTNFNRFATSFITLAQLHKQRNNLHNYTRNVAYALKLTGPLVKVLRNVDGDKKPAMGYIYEAMDRLQETISTSFANKEVHYRKAFEIIERRWDFQLHGPLHAAGHFLNPQWFYDKSKNVDCE
nr:hypothetical protein [Tanacetum cinerariifolium]